MDLAMAVAAVVVRAMLNRMCEEMLDAICGESRPYHDLGVNQMLDDRLFGRVSDTVTRKTLLLRQKKTNSNTLRECTLTNDRWGVVNRSNSQKTSTGLCSLLALPIACYLLAQSTPFRPSERQRRVNVAGGLKGRSSTSSILFSERPAYLRQCGTEMPTRMYVCRE